MSLICVHEFHLFLQERKHWLTSSNVQDENRNATERGKGRASKTTTFDCHWKSMEIWLGTKHLVCCRGCNALVFIFKIYKRGLYSMKGVWHSPNMLPTMVYSQAFCITTYLLAGEILSSSVRLSPGNFYFYKSENNNRRMQNCLHILNITFFNIWFSKYVMVLWEN